MGAGRISREGSWAQLRSLQNLRCFLPCYKQKIIIAIIIKKKERGGKNSSQWQEHVKVDPTVAIIRLSIPQCFKQAHHSL